MGSFSDYLENKVLDHVTGKSSYTAPTVYVALSTADPTDDASGMAEPTAGTGAYARVTTSASDWASASSGATSNAAALTFATSTDAWSTGATNLTHFALYDALTSGNMLAHGELSTPRAVNAANVILEFAIGDLDITLS